MSNQGGGCEILDMLDACNFLKKEFPAQMFYCKFYEIFKNTIFIEHIPLD